NRHFASCAKIFPENPKKLFKIPQICGKVVSIGEKCSNSPVIYAAGRVIEPRREKRFDDSWTMQAKTSATFWWPAMPVAARRR
ncbi:MAG: hypothetical protein ACLTNY_09715, partial [Blautia massiliensis (ex Durand et al. 2017)]